VELLALEPVKLLREHLELQLKNRDLLLLKQHSELIERLKLLGDLLDRLVLLLELG
jgi:hypothetical protein